MSSHSSDLAVRRHERYACALPARVRVAPAHAQAVRPGRAAADPDGAAPATAVDFSLGGLGLHSSVFFPVGCHLIVMLDVSGVRVEAMIRVQRVVMADRKPTYYIGGAIEAADPSAERTMQQALEALKASGAQPVKEKSGA